MISGFVRTFTPHFYQCKACNFYRFVDRGGSCCRIGFLYGSICPHCGAVMEELKPPKDSTPLGFPFFPLGGTWIHSEIATRRFIKKVKKAHNLNIKFSEVEIIWAMDGTRPNFTPKGKK